MDGTEKILRERFAELHSDMTRKPASGTLDELRKLNQEQEPPLAQEDFKALWNELRRIPPAEGREYLRQYGERCLGEEGMTRRELYKRLWNSNHNNLLNSLDDNAIGRLVKEVWVSETTILKGDNLIELYDKCFDGTGFLVDELIYPEAVHTIFSPGGTGKTIFALWTEGEVIKKGGKVLYVDAENGGKHILRLCRAYGWSLEFMRESFIYMYQPDINKGNCEIWADTLYYHKPDLVIFDSLADFLSVDGFKENDAVDVTEWMRLYAQPVKDGGGAALILDHVAKDVNTKGPRGSTAKRNAVDAAWKLEAKKLFNKEATGRIELFPDKDRFGELPSTKSFRIGRGDIEGQLICEPITTSEEGMEEEPLLTNNQKKALGAIDTSLVGLTYTEWRERSGLADTSFQTAKKYLVKHGYVGYDEIAKTYNRIYTQHPVEV